MTLTPQQIGKRFEHDLEETFRALQREYGFAWTRFTDTHEAGNVVREQPADFLVKTPHGLTFVEAKASVTLDHFVPSLLRPSQRKAIRHYAQMLDTPYVVLFRDDTAGRVDMLQGKFCLGDGSRKPIPTVVSTRSTHLLSTLVRQWNLPPLITVLKKFKNRYGDT